MTATVQPDTSTRAERQRARWAVKYAIQTGRLRRGACEQTGRECAGPIEAHHDDYSKPLKVRWFCRRHHRKLDGPKMARPKPPRRVNPATRKMYERLKAEQKGATKVQRTNQSTLQPEG